jgi:hypothetical protein
MTFSTASITAPLASKLAFHVFIDTAVSLSIIKQLAKTYLKLTVSKSELIISIFKFIFTHFDHFDKVVIIMYSEYISKL